MKYHLMILVCVCIMSISQSCVSHVEEELYPEECDTIAITYSLSVTPIIEYNCYECHSGEFPSSGIPLDEYTDVKKKVDDGTLVGSIRHQQGYIPMPEERPALPECEIQTIEKWVAEGAPNN